MGIIESVLKEILEAFVSVFIRPYVEAVVEYGKREVSRVKAQDIRKWLSTITTRVQTISKNPNFRLIALLVLILSSISFPLVPESAEIPRTADGRRINLAEIPRTTDGQRINTEKQESLQNSEGICRSENGRRINADSYTEEGSSVCAGEDSTRFQIIRYKSTQFM